MAGSIVLSGLVAKRAELAGEVQALDARLTQLRADLVHLDAAILIMRPDAEPELIRPRKISRKAAIVSGDRSCPVSSYGPLEKLDSPCRATVSHGPSWFTKAWTRATPSPCGTWRAW